MAENEIFDELQELILADARKTYSETVIDHFLYPRNAGELQDPDSYAVMSGICGDTIEMFVGLDLDRIDRISFVTNGCGPTIACSSALTCLVKGCTVAEAMHVSGADVIGFLGGLPLESTHCADLAVNTLRGALEKLS